MQKKALGKGLEALMREEISKKDEKSWVTEIPLDKIDISLLQPREKFSEHEMESLVSSIKEEGVLQPVLVRQKGERFELIAGERRLRAAKRAGINNIPAVVRQVSDGELLQLSLIENLQRTDLTPVEQAIAYKKLQHDFGLSQEEIAKRVSKDRSTITNYLRLLTLPKFILDKLNTEKISFGHAKVMLSLQDKNKQIALCNKVLSKSLSVRKTEQLVSKVLEGREIRKRKAMKIPPQIRDIEDRLSKKLGTKVQISFGRKKGKIQIEYYSEKDLERIISIIVDKI